MSKELRQYLNPSRHNLNLTPKNPKPTRKISTQKSSEVPPPPPPHSIFFFRSPFPSRFEKI